MTIAILALLLPLGFIAYDMKRIADALENKLVVVTAETTNH